MALGDSSEVSKVVSLSFHYFCYFPTSNKFVTPCPIVSNVKNLISRSIQVDEFSSYAKEMSSKDFHDGGKVYCH